MLNRSIKQTENRLEIRYSFMTDTVRGFFVIEEHFTGDVKMVSHKIKAPYTFKENKLKIMGASVKGQETYVFVFEGNGNVELHCVGKFENYPWNSIANKFEKSAYVLEKPKAVAEVKTDEKKETVINSEPEKKETSSVNNSNEKKIIAGENPGRSDKKDPAITNAVQPVQAGIRYRIQLAASSSKMDIARLKSLTGLDQVVFEDIIDNLYKYTVGDETSLNAAQDLLNKLAVNNFKKPFIVAYQDGKRISMAQAQLK